jgi:hypothetical protein
MTSRCTNLQGSKIANSQSEQDQQSSKKEAKMVQGVV